jgi:hypothetical protein
MLVLNDVNIRRFTVYYLFNLGYTYREISEIIHPGYSYEAMERQLKRDKKDAEEILSKYNRG